MPNRLQLNFCVLRPHGGMQNIPSTHRRSQFTPVFKVQSYYIINCARLSIFCRIVEYFSCGVFAVVLYFCVDAIGIIEFVSCIITIATGAWCVMAALHKWNVKRNGKYYNKMIKRKRGRKTLRPFLMAVQIYVIVTMFILILINWTRLWFPKLLSVSRYDQLPKNFLAFLSFATIIIACLTVISYCVYAYRRNLPMVHWYLAGTESILIAIYYITVYSQILF